MTLTDLQSCYTIEGTVAVMYYGYDGLIGIGYNSCEAAYQDWLKARRPPPIENSIT